MPSCAATETVMIIHPLFRKALPMKASLDSLNIHLARVSTKHLRLVMLIVTLSLFVLGAGAPEEGSGFGG